MPVIGAGAVFVGGEGGGDGGSSEHVNVPAPDALQSASSKQSAVAVPTDVNAATLDTEPTGALPTSQYGGL